MGGATPIPFRLSYFSKSLSPRGRGNPVLAAAVGEIHGSIPAWAGQPTASCIHASFTRVYPRVGGATRPLWNQPRASHGLSPRGRGNRRHHRCHPPGQRSIPAWAGQPMPTAPCWYLRRVYPRVGGATRGNLLNGVVMTGLSPRGRGNHADHHLVLGPFRSIPAWAGQPLFGEYWQGWIIRLDD